MCFHFMGIMSSSFVKNVHLNNLIFYSGRYGLCLNDNSLADYFIPFVSALL